MFICSPISSGFALLGSAVGVLTGLWLGVTPASLYAGLWGFSAVLTSIAIGGMFFVVNRFSTFAFAVIAAMITAIIHGATGAFLRPFGLPALTFPFNFVGWVFCLAGNVMGNVFSVEITAISVPEDHIKRVRLVIHMASQFKEIKQLSSSLNVSKPEDLNKLEKVLTPVLLCWYASTGDIK